MPAGDALSRAGWQWAGHPGTLGSWRETHHQRIEVSTGPPFSLYADGQLLATYPDVYVTVPRAHSIMLLHPDPRRVFALGCIADGSLIPMTRHPVDEIVAVEEDPNLLGVIPRWFGWSPPLGVFDPRVQTTTTDPLRALSSGGPWDLVILLDGNPTTIRRNRTRSLEFFSSCRDRMAADGILVLRIEVTDTYLGGSAGRLLEVMVSTLGKVFAQVAAIPGEEILVVAGGPAAEITLDVDELTSRWSSRKISDPSFAPGMLETLIDPSRVPALENAVRIAQGPLNTMNRPRAVLLSAGLHEARARSSILDLSRMIESRPATPLTVATGLAAAMLLGLAMLRRPPASAASAVVGLCSMGWWLLLIAAWQATLGSVYAEIGALTAAFMGGLAAGSVVASRLPRPAQSLPWVLGAGVLLSIAIGTGAPMRLPSLLVPILLLVSGSLTGAAFPGLARLSRGEKRGNLERRGAGVAFAADEAGAAAAALIVGIVALPWAGMIWTAVGLAVLGAAAIPAVVVRLRRDKEVINSPIVEP
jgi:spermidine synthase